MDRDSKEAKGQGALLHVIKWDPNVWVSSFKELIDLTLRPSNHLIATSPKLDENLAHQGFVLRMYIHLLIKVANMFNRVYSAIIQGESKLSESPRKSSFLNPAGERWFRNLVECFIRSVIYQASRRWIIVSASIAVFFIIRERFVGGSSWSLPIVLILLIIGKVGRIRGSSPSALVA